MKILSKTQDIYSVELINNGKSLTDYMFELRKNKEQKSPIINEVIPEPVQQFVPKPAIPPPITKAEPTPRVFNENVRPSSLPIQPVINESKRSVEINSNKSLPPPPPPTVTATKPVAVSDTSFKEQNNNNSNYSDNLTTMITEQRRQNRLLEQVIAAINTTNALLTQLVQR